jgi:hypothetical protein
MGGGSFEGSSAHLLSCGNSLTARSGHMMDLSFRRRGQEAWVRGAERGFPSRRPCASGSGRRRAAPRAASAQGSTAWVLMWRRNSPFRRSIALVVRGNFHCDGSSRVKVKSRSPASSKLSTTARHVRRYLRRKASRRVSSEAEANSTASIRRIHSRQRSSGSRSARSRSRSGSRRSLAIAQTP